MSKKVTIVGGGVVGLILAKELAGMDVETTVYEARRVVGEGSERASGILSVNGLNSMGVDYRGAVLNSLDGAVLYAGGQRLDIKARETKAFVLDRPMLARQCASEAVAAGARVEVGRRLEREELKRLGKEGILVGADGAVSNVASAFGFPRIREYVLTYKAEYENARIGDAHSAELFFSHGASYRFFGWTVPYSNRVLEVGLGESVYSRRSSSAAFNSFISGKMMAERLRGSTVLAEHAGIIPMEARKATIKGNVLLVGDAAGQVKATTGGGLVFGALCAKVAAAVISNHIKRGTPLSLYEKAWRRKHGLDLRMHRMIRGYYSSLGSRGFGMVFRFSKLFGIDDFLSRHGDMDRPSVIARRLIFR